MKARKARKARRCVRCKARKAQRRVKHVRREAAKARKAQKCVRHVISQFLELVVSENILFSLYAIYVTFSLFYLCFLCYSRLFRDDILGDCSSYPAFVAHIINTEKKCQGKNARPTFIKRDSPNDLCNCKTICPI